MFCPRIWGFAPLSPPPDPSAPSGIKHTRILSILTLLSLVLLLFFAFSPKTLAQPLPVDEQSVSDFIRDSDLSPDTPAEVVDHGAAPRTSSEPYNALVSRGFVYSPSGGFNNQRMELEYVLEIGRLLNRTVYVPMAAKHTSMWNAYEALKEKDLFPMDRLIDFPFMETYGTRVVPLNVSVSRFVYDCVKKLGQKEVQIFLHAGDTQVFSWHEAQVREFNRRATQRIVYLRGRGVYHKWFPPAKMVEIRKRVRYSKYLRDMAVRFKRELTHEKPLYAMHIRLGDMIGARSSISNFVGSFIATAHFRHWATLKNALYVSTDKGRGGRDFLQLNHVFPLGVLYAEDIPKNLEGEFRKLFPNNRDLHEDMLGLIEQLICAQAIDFIPSPGSTFSIFISFLRLHRHDVFPEIINVQYGKHSTVTVVGGNATAAEPGEVNELDEAVDADKTGELDEAKETDTENDEHGNGVHLRRVV